MLGLMRVTTAAKEKNKNIYSAYLGIGTALALCFGVRVAQMENQGKSKEDEGVIINILLALIYLNRRNKNQAFNSRSRHVF